MVLQEAAEARVAEDLQGLPALGCGKLRKLLRILDLVSPKRHGGRRHVDVVRQLDLAAVRNEREGSVHGSHIFQRLRMDHILDGVGNADKLVGDRLHDAVVRADEALHGLLRVVADDNPPGQAAADLDGSGDAVLAQADPRQFVFNLTPRDRGNLVFHASSFPARLLSRRLLWFYGFELAVFQLTEDHASVHGDPVNPD